MKLKHAFILLWAVGLVSCGDVSKTGNQDSKETEKPVRQIENFEYQFSPLKISWDMNETFLSDYEIQYCSSDTGKCRPYGFVNCEKIEEGVGQACEFSEPTQSSALAGVRMNHSVDPNENRRSFDLADDVTDFSTGIYLRIRAVFNGKAGDWVLGEKRQVF